MSNTQASGIQIWYWPRLSQSIPYEIVSGNSLTPNDDWGTPAANFPMVPGYCDYPEYFNAQQIIFDLTFCVSTLIYFSFLSQRVTDTLSFCTGRLRWLDLEPVQLCNSVPDLLSL
jgi:hypothetical protein